MPTHGPYPVKFFATRIGSLFRWIVYSEYPDGQWREVAGPFWRRSTAERWVGELTKHFRNGFDMGQDDATAQSRRV